MTGSYIVMSRYSNLLLHNQKLRYALGHQSHHNHLTPCKLDLAVPFTEYCKTMLEFS